MTHDEWPAGTALRFGAPFVIRQLPFWGLVLLLISFRACLPIRFRVYPRHA